MKYHSIVEQKIEGSFKTHYLLELFRYSGYFAIVNILLELVLEGPVEFLASPDLYSIVIAVLVQAYILTRQDIIKNIFWGNLIAPTIYTLVETAIEGLAFYAAPHHQAYWVFSILIASTRYLSGNKKLQAYNSGVILVENLIKSLLIYAMYMILESKLDAQPFNIVTSLQDEAHLFLLLGTLFLGVAIGLAEIVRGRYLELLTALSMELKSYSEWLFGKALLEEAVTNPDSLNLKQVERTVLFMDIRGFTKWCEAHQPSEVTDMLERYFTHSESILYDHDAIKVMYTGDEVLAVFAQPSSAVQAAVTLQNLIGNLLDSQGIGAGIGIHSGAVMEGMIGGENIKHFGVIGDTVNTGKRVESNASAGEILLSDAMVAILRDMNFRLGEERTVPAKGKSEPLSLYPLLAPT